MPESITPAQRHRRRQLWGAVGALDQAARNVERRLALLDSEFEAERSRRRTALAEQLADIRRRRAEAVAQLDKVPS